MYINNIFTSTDIIISTLTKTIIISLALNNLTPHDSLSKKTTLAFSIGFLITISQKIVTSPLFVFIFYLICIQILLLGILYHFQIKIILILTMIITNMIGATYIFTKNLQKQLYSSPQTLWMFLESLTIFLVIFLIEIILAKIECSLIIRRKIFYLIPLILISYLYSSKYISFMLILGMIFYVFLQIQFLRYISTVDCPLADMLSDWFPVLDWFQQLNDDRQKNFRFLHLFIILAFVIANIFYNRNIGIILAISDTIGALVANFFPRRQFLNKNVVGFIFFVLASIMGQLVLKIDQQMRFTLVSSIVCGLVQYCTDQFDVLKIIFSFILVDFLF